jgi:hypothetical protein
VRCLQLPAKLRLLGRNAGKREEARLEAARQHAAVLQVLDRPALRVEQLLDSLDDRIAMGQEALEQLDVRLERHFVQRWRHGSAFSH